MVLARAQIDDTDARQQRFGVYAGNALRLICSWHYYPRDTEEHA
jgi:hypothetical protein